MRWRSWLKWLWTARRPARGSVLSAGGAIGIVDSLDLLARIILGLFVHSFPNIGQLADDSHGHARLDVGELEVAMRENGVDLFTSDRTGTVKPKFYTTIYLPRLDEA